MRILSTITIYNTCHQKYSSSLHQTILLISGVVPVPKTKTGKQKKTYEERQAEKRELDQDQNRRRVNIRAALHEES